MTVSCQAVGMYQAVSQDTRNPRVEFTTVEFYLQPPDVTSIFPLYIHITRLAKGGF